MYLIIFLLSLVSCAGVAPVPGGGETINKTYYTTKEEFVETLEKIDAWHA